MYSNSTIIDYYAEIMANHLTINDDEEFGTVLGSAGSGKLVVVDFNATWCEPCQKMHPVFIKLAHKFPHALFLGVDVDLCHETAVEQGVSAMPTFVLYKNRVQIDTLRGANPKELEDKIRIHYGGPGISDPTFLGAGVPASDISRYISQKECECLNESDSTPFQDFLEGKSILKSDINEQLILVYGFNQIVKLHSFKIKSTGFNGPKVIKLFINQPNTLDFPTARTLAPLQEILLEEKDLTGRQTIELRAVKFHSVRNLQIFIAENQNGDNETQIDSLILFGTPEVPSLTNLQQIKEKETQKAGSGSQRQGHGHDHGHGYGH